MVHLGIGMPSPDLSVSSPHRKVSTIMAARTSAVLAVALCLFLSAGRQIPPINAVGRTDLFITYYTFNVCLPFIECSSPLRSG